MVCRKDSLVTGVPLGVDDRMPRVPAAWKRKLKLRECDDDDGEEPEDGPNYPSARDNAADHKNQFEEEFGGCSSRRIYRRPRTP